MKEYVPKLKPWSHQREALKRLVGRKAFALLMAMRTGKTKVTLDDFGRLESKGECSSLLIIAPAGVYHTWKDAIEENVSSSLLKRLNIHVWSAGAGTKETSALKHFMQLTDTPRILIINVEALSAVDRAKKLCIEFLKQRPSMIAIDESTTIKNHSAARTKFIVRQLAPLGLYKRILSGLPTPQSPLDLYSQFYFLDPRILGFTSYFAFRARYAIMQRMDFGGRAVPVVVGYRDIEELSDRIRPYSYRVTLEDCYDLPEKMYQIREVQLTPEQKRIYNEIRLYATSSLGNESFVTATMVITQILRLHQVLCGHVKDEMGIMHQIPENRTQTLIDLLAEHEGKAIVWCSYDENIRGLTVALEKAGHNVARFWGGNKSTREKEEKLFVTDPKYDIMLATPDAGGRGRMWAVADLVVYFSSKPNLEHRLQSEERTQAVDKAASVLYVDLIAKGTVEEKILKALRNKLNMSSIINGDNYREWLI